MFKKEKGITLIALIVTIVVLIILAGITITGTIQGVDQANNNKLITDLDKVHHAITERDSKYKLTKDESLLIGTVVKSSNIDVTGLSESEKITWKMLDFDGVTDPERDYYRLSGSDLVQLGLTSDPTTTTVYVVNYFTGEAYNETQKKTEDGKLLYVTSTTEQVSEMGDEIIKDGLLVWYDAENNTGSGHSSTTTVWKDLSGNGRDGVMNNVTIGSNYAEFNGTSSWVNLGEINDFTNAITLEAIVSIPEALNNEKDIICNQQEGGVCLRLYSNKPEFVVYLKNIGYVVFQSNISVPINKICHIVGRYSGTDFKIYLNGVEQTDITIMDKVRNQISTTIFNNNTINKPLTNTVMALGCNPRGNRSEINYFRGKIFDAKIYNRALSEDEVKHNYLIDKAKYGIEE